MKIIISILVIYLLVGVGVAVKWSREYDPKVNSMPNDAVTFMVNILLWPF